MTVQAPLMAHAMAMFPIVYEYQTNGIPCDPSRLALVHDELTTSMAEIQQRLSRDYYGGAPINPGSPNQTRLLLERHGLRSRKKTPSGLDSTSEPGIGYLRFEHPCVQTLFEWRQVQHCRDSFVTPVLDRLDAMRDDYAWRGVPFPAHPRIRCQILWTRTPTRRFAARDPNQLAIPSRSAVGMRVRECYVAPPGMLFGSWDLSQIEGRYQAHESQDPLLLDFFRNGKDIHSETASRVFGVPLDAVTKDQRRAAKTINFGIIYGQTGQGLQTELWKLGIFWDLATCQAAVDKYYATYVGFTEYVERLACQVQRDERVWDVSGKCRRLPYINSHIRRFASQARRHAVSHRIQGGAQTMIQNSMRWLVEPTRELRRRYHVEHLLQTHDDLLLLFDEAAADEVEALVLEALTQHHGIDDFSVPVLADGKVGRTWADVK